MTKSKERKCHKIIHSASASAGAAAAAASQVPGSDSAIIVPIQVTMIISLGKVFGETIDKSWAKSALASYIATFVGRKISQFAIGWIPGLGNVVNASTAAGVTEMIGWAVAEDFARQNFHTKAIMTS